MKELMIIRHARSLYNIEATKDLDAGLTDYGHQQATMAGKFLNEFEGNWNIITSPFLRCLQTSGHIADATQCGVLVDSTLGEMTVDYHDLVSLKVDKRVVFPYNWFNYDPVDFAHERMDDYLQRLESFWRDVPNRSIIVTHGSPVLSFIHMHKGNFDSVPLWDHSVGNCSMTWIKGNRMIWRARELFWELPDRVWSRGVNENK